MDGKFIAVSNMKGGVGKTTTVVSLAEFLALDGKTSVLVVDLDPQASASICIAGDVVLANLIEAGRTLDAFLAVKLIKNDQASLEKRIRRACCTVTSDGNPIFINLIPTSPHLRLVERELLYKLMKRKFDMDEIERRLLIFFESEILPLRHVFDYIIFDCAPGISPLTETAIRSSDLVLVPTIPDRLSAFGLLGFCEMIQSGGPSGTARIPALRVLLSRVQNTRQHREFSERIHAMGLDVLSTTIPQSATLAEGVMVEAEDGFNIPTLNKKYGATMIQVFKNLSAEVRRAIL